MCRSDICCTKDYFCRNVLISLGVSGFLNADSFTIANALWNNGNLRTAVVASAQKAADNPPPTAPNASSKSKER